MSSYMWVYDPKPVKLKPEYKSRLLLKIDMLIKADERLSKAVNKVTIRAGRVYIYALYEQTIPEGIELNFIVPLIDGKYKEISLARITLYDDTGISCTADWQRHTGEWVDVSKGTLEECIKFISESDFFDYPLKSD